MSGYTPNKWVDREGTTRYFETVDEDGALIFTPDYTQVTEMGTPVNEDNMNHIEDGIAAVSFSKYDSMTTYSKDDLVTAIVENELKVYKSLQDNNNGNALTDSSYWEEVEFAGGSGAGLQLFDTILKDHVLTYEESKGLALQGTYVYKEAIAGSRYGYPDFYAKCLEEYTEATSTETVNDVEVKVHSNGHKFYNISDKTAIDDFFNSMGSAWFYGVDTENERIFLPRKNLYDITKNLDVDVYGNGNTLGLTTGEQTATLKSYTDGAELEINPDAFGHTLPVQVTGFDRPSAGYIVGVATSPSESGIVGSVDLSKSESTNYLYICVGNSTNYEGMTEVVNQGMEILEQVSQKVNIDGSNLNQEGKTLISSYTMPSDNYVVLNVGANGSIYTAPANGWFRFSGRPSSSGGLAIGLRNENSKIEIISRGIYQSVFIPVRKSDRCTIIYDEAVSDDLLYFVYAEGEI